MRTKPMKRLAENLQKCGRNNREIPSLRGGIVLWKMYICILVNDLMLIMIVREMLWSEL